MSFNEYWQAEQQRRNVADAIAALKPGDGAAYQRFYKALRAAPLLLPVEQVPEGMQNGELLTGKNVPIQVKMVQGAEEKVYLPLFTSESALRQVHDAEQPFVVVNFNTFSQMALQANVGGIVVDRGGPASAVVQLSVLLSLIKGNATEQAAPPAAQLKVGPPPRVVDYEELAALDSWLHQQPGVAQAYLFGLSQSKEQAVLTLGLSLAEPPTTEQVRAMARELGEILGPSGIIGMDARLATLLARQAGAIRFDLRKLR